MRDRAPIQTAALAVGLVFVAVGVAGFIPGITTSLYGGLDLAGNESEAELLGIFQVSVLHNLVHLGFGLAGLVLARTVRESRIYLVGGGAIYLVLWIYGLVIDLGSNANFVPVNTADNWLHLALAIGMIGLGLALGRETGRGPARTASPGMR